MQTESRFAVSAALITAKISTEELSSERQTQSRWGSRLVGEGQAKERVTVHTKEPLASRYACTEMLRLDRRHCTQPHYRHGWGLQVPFLSY